ncbi:hypothetical protein [Capnocytophaga canis]|uniref:hypothetical protein n=1 Tax=Capnocytophaga canis TaxID=1848903 RepID=UPI001562C563|nr:hypothetical protein [Capnocytophaga canis]
MKVIFSQIYIQVGVNFNFSHQFQTFLSSRISELLCVSKKFIKLHDEDYTIVIRISAKKELTTNEIKGATIYKKDKDVEFTIFLPYTPIMQTSEPSKSALEYLFEGVYDILQKYEIDILKLKAEQKKIIDKIMSSPEMFRE